MTPALTPALALDYLTALSADIRAGVVLASDGDLLAGAAELAGPARELLAAAEIASVEAGAHGSAPERDYVEAEVATAAGGVYAVRSDRHAVVVVTGRFALSALARYDLRVVLAELDRVRVAA